MILVFDVEAKISEVIGDISLLADQLSSEDSKLITKEKIIPDGLWSIVESALGGEIKSLDLPVVQLNSKYLGFTVIQSTNSHRLVITDQTRTYSEVFPVQQERNDALVEKWEIKKLKNQLEQKNLELLGLNSCLEDLAYITSHDLRAPIRTIGFLVEWIEEDCVGKLPIEAEENLKKIKQKTEVANSILDGVLDFAKSHQVDLGYESLTWGELVAEILSCLEIPAFVSFHVDSPSLELKIQKSALIIVLRNMFQNSIKHSGNKQISIKAGVKEGPKFYEILVSDSGPGIEEKQLSSFAKVFESENPSLGKIGGFGLTIIFKIVRKVGGGLRVYNNQPQGLSFLINWPKGST